jgi:polyisoprenoid-binding protein YceI
MDSSQSEADYALLRMHWKSLLAQVFFTCRLQQTGLRTGTWMVDADHSYLGFSIKHLGITTVRGSFGDYTGSLHIGEDGAFLVDGMVRAESLQTGNRNRDIHIRNDEDFFFVQRFPTIHFLSEDIQPVGKSMYVVAGQLSLRGYQRPVEWQVYLNGYAYDQHEQQRMALSVEGELNRKDWGFSWNQFVEAGGMLVSEKVKIHLELSLVLQEQHPSSNS